METKNVSDKLTAGKTEISFAVNKNGKVLAYRYSRRQMRHFRIGIEEAKLALATGAAVQVAHCR